MAPVKVGFSKGQVQQMANRSAATSIDEYIAEFPEPVQAALQEMRAIIRQSAPDAVETISYAIPTFDLNGRHVVHFAGYAHHVGFYPTGKGMDEFREEFAGYKTGRGSVQFPLDKPLPTELIRRVVEQRYAEETARGSK